MIETKNLTLSYEHKNVFNDVHVTIPDGKITVLIGANGSGKSTLLKAISKLLMPQKGHVYIDNTDINELKGKELAKKLTMLPQSATAPSDLSIYDLVKQGRYPYHTLISRWTAQDEEIVLSAITKMGLLDVKDTKLSELSGGQKQRAWIALTLAQNTGLILLDEPTNHLDIRYQIEILELLRELNKKENRTIIMVLHDINYAIRYADYIIALKDGQVYAQDAKENIISEKLVNEIYDINCKLIEHENEFVCVPFL